MRRIKPSAQIAFAVQASTSRRAHDARWQLDLPAFVSDMNASMCGKATQVSFCEDLLMR